MVGEPTPLAAIVTDPEILPELVRPLLAAFEAPPYDAVVDITGVGGDRDPAWLLPTRVTVRVRLSPLMFALLQDLKRGSTHAVPTALAVVYAETEARYGHASVPAGRRPLGVEFHPRPRQVFRFVFGAGLQPRDVSHALEEVPTTFQQALERCRRNEDILESFARDYVEPTADERALEVVHLYEGPVHGWQVIA